MLQAFIIVLREGFESFLIVAVIVSYLRKTNQRILLPAVQWGVVLSVLLSGSLGYFILQGLNQPFWEGVFGVVSAILVGWFVVHMWRTASHLKADMEKRLTEISRRSGKAEWTGVFLFTLFMISREGMETALMLIQIHDAKVISGSALGFLAAAALAFAWIHLGHLINLKRFFQVTSIFLFLFIIQILIYSFHEFIESGIIPNSDVLNAATEPFSPVGIYGKWISLGMVVVCAAWLVGAWLMDYFSSSHQNKQSG